MTSLFSDDVTPDNTEGSVLKVYFMILFVLEEHESKLGCVCLRMLSNPQGCSYTGSHDVRALRSVHLPFTFSLNLSARFTLPRGVCVRVRVCVFVV